MTRYAPLLPPISRTGLILLRYFVLIPAGVILICVCILLSGSLPPRSPRIADLGLLVAVTSFIEAVSFGVLVAGLLRKRTAPTKVSILTATLGGFSLLPAAAVATIMVVNELR
jgi:hypothetical protein